MVLTDTVHDIKFFLLIQTLIKRAEPFMTMEFFWNYEEYSGIICDAKTIGGSKTQKQV